jgi:thymidylate synthase
VGTEGEKVNFEPAPYIKGRTIAEVWPRALSCIVATAHWRQLCGEPHIVTDQRGDETYEVEGLQVVITDPLKGMIPEIPKAPGVTAWSDKARLDEYFETEIIGTKPKPEGFSYVYADWIKPMVGGIIATLQADPETRRAIIQVGDKYDHLKDDPACLRWVLFLIRRGELDTLTAWRSRAYAGAAATNMYGLIRLQEHVAQKLEVPVGRYIDFSGSAHIRIRDDLWWVEKVI